MEKKFDKKELDYFLNLLSTAKDEESIESYIYIKNILNSIEFPVPFTIYGKGTKFVRSRAHKENEDFFETVDQISYRRDIQNIKNFGRGNEPGQSVFYCTNDSIVSFAETSSIVREDNEKEFEYMTTGIWILTENIMVVNLIPNENTIGQHTEFEESTKDFERFIESQNDESAFVVKELLQFLSKEFSTAIKENSNHYKITAAFTNYVFDSFDKADGIFISKYNIFNRRIQFCFKNRNSR